MHKRFINIAGQPVQKLIGRLVLPLAIYLVSLLILGGCANLMERPLDVFVTEKNDSINVRSTIESVQLGSQTSVDSKAVKKFALAALAITEEDFTRAESLLLELISTYPEYSSVRTNLAVLYSNTGRVDEALPLLDTAISLEPKDCLPRIQLGLIERSRNNFPAAEQAYLDCLVVQPNNSTALINLGILYELYIGHFENAIAAYDRYQQSVLAPDQRVALWISNLSRRLKTTSQLASGDQF